MNKRLLIILI